MKEEEIRPENIFEEYLQLAKNDALFYFSEVVKDAVVCPACGDDGTYAFTKQGFEYKECPVCQTLFVSLRPQADAFCRYYKESESVKYWATTFYKETAEVRRIKLWQPKALMVRDIIVSFAALDYGLVDIGGGYGIFAQEYEKITHQKVTVIEPGPDLALVCREKGLYVIQGFLEDIKKEEIRGHRNSFVSFELFEHLHDPKCFLEHLILLMNGGDLFIFSTLSSTGLDIQALWEDSKSVSPPHHLNFFNPKSIRLLLEMVGFKVLQVSTPGHLDIDILCNNKKLIKDRFWRTFVNQASEHDKEAMQAFIAANSLSSHLLVVCKKL